MDLVQILVEEDGYLEQRPRPEAADAYRPVPLQPEQCSQPLVSQLVAGSLARPELAQGVLERMEQWVDLCEQAVRKVFADAPLVDLVPVRELAYGLVSYYLGANLLTHLGGAKQTEALFAKLEELTPAVAPYLRG